MRTIANAVCKPAVARALVVLFAGTAVASVCVLSQLRYDDDPLAFLPKNDRDVLEFRRLSQRFGGLDVALIGVRAADGDRGIFTPETLRRIAFATRALEQRHDVDRVLSLANVVDFSVDDGGGLTTQRLFDATSVTQKHAANLARLVDSRHHLIGQLVSLDHSSAVIYAFIVPGSNGRQAAQAIRQVVVEYFDRDRVRFGGAPFVSEHVFRTTGQDLNRLSRYALIAMVGLLLVAFRSALATALVLVTAAVGIVQTFAIMVLLGQPLNILLSALPVVLFAVGSAYAIHVLASFRRHVAIDGLDRVSAVRRAVRSAGQLIVVAALTTAASLLSFVAMDVVPLRVFGLYSVVGILMMLMSALIFLPALLRLLPPRVPMLRTTTHAQRFVTWLIQYRVAIGLMVGAFVALCGYYATLVDHRLDAAALFDEQSEPALADRFFEKRFDGSQFLHVALDADVRDPDQLRRVRWIAQRLGALPDVSQVVDITQVLSLANQALQGDHRLPATRDQAKLLLAFVGDDPAVQQLVDRDRDQTLVHVRVRKSDAQTLERVLSATEALLQQQKHTSTLMQYADAIARLLSIDDIAGVATTLRRPVHGHSEVVTRSLMRYLRSDEWSIPLPSYVSSRLIAQELGVRAGKHAVSIETMAWETRIARVVRDVFAESERAAKVNTPPELIEEVAFALNAPVQQAVRRARAAERFDQLRSDKSFGEGNTEANVLREMRSPKHQQLLGMLIELDELPVDLWKRRMQPVSGRVSGQPVIYRALSQSAFRNQWLSLSIALAAVVLIVAGFFRSLMAGIVIALPSAITLIVVQGVMGFTGIRLDIGTAMLASLTLGVGVDYAVHLAAHWDRSFRQLASHGVSSDDSGLRRSSLDMASAAIISNALGVAVGFVVLGFAESRPLQNLGRLTALAMVVAGLATFVVVPMLWRRSNSRA